MGSFQQISIGVICLVAAFLFGSYVNSHPDPDQVTHAFSDLAGQDDEGAVTSLLDPGVAEQRAAPIETLRSQLASRLPTLKSMSDSRLSLDLPPPSQLDQPVVNDQKIVTPTRMPNLLDSSGRREVEVPDFSRLAAEFKNTPLELPPMQPLNSSGDRSSFDQSESTRNELSDGWFAETGPKEAEPNDSLISPQTIPQQSRQDNIELSLKDRIQGSSPVAGMDRDMLKLNPPTQAPELNAPKLAADPANPGPAATVFNAVRSYQEQDPIAPAFVAGEPPSNENSISQVIRQEPDQGNSQPSVTRSKPAPIVSAKPKIPFGLTEQAKTQFVKLKRRPDSQITLGTSKFKTHKTLRGDSLQKISTRYYGKPDFYLDIYLANQDRLRNPVDVPVGVMLKIPVYE